MFMPRGRAGAGAGADFESRHGDLCVEGGGAGSTNLWKRFEYPLCRDDLTLKYTCVDKADDSWRACVRREAVRAVRVVRPRTVKVEEATDTVCLNELSIGIVLPFPTDTLHTRVTDAVTGSLHRTVQRHVTWGDIQRTPHEVCSGRRGEILWGGHRPRRPASTKAGDRSASPKRRSASRSRDQHSVFTKA